MSFYSNINDEVLHGLVLEALKSTCGTGGGSQVGVLAGVVAKLAHQRGLVVVPQRYGRNAHDSGVEDDDNMRVRDAAYTLIFEGLIRPGLNTSNPDFPWFHITAYGMQVLTENRPGPHDPEGYFREVKAIHGIDDVVLSYLMESVECFRKNLMKSSIIMVGISSERAFYLFLESVCCAIVDATRQANAMKALMEPLSIQKSYDGFMRGYKVPLEAALKAGGDPGRELLHNMDAYLSTMFLNVKAYRNDVGHAQIVTASKRVAEGHLVLFPDYLKKVFALIQWLTVNRVL